MARHCDVVLVNPFFPAGGNDGWSALGEHLFSPDQICEHLGIAYLASALRDKGYRVAIVDGDVSRLCNDEVVSQVCDLDATVVGITVCHETYKQSVDLLERIKASTRALVVVGGPLLRVAGSHAAALFPSADALVLGEGESSIVEAVHSLVSHSRQTVPLVFRDPPAIALDEIAFPARDALSDAFRRQQQLGLPKSIRVLSSRGCPGKCNYCSIADYAKVNPDEIFWRPRSARNVVDEMEDLKNRYRPDCFFFSDDIFLCGHRGRQRALQIADLLQARRLSANFTFSCRVTDISHEVFASLKRAGLYHVSFGVETIDLGSLHALSKGRQPDSFLRAFDVLEALDLSVSVYMMLYHPFTSLSEIDANYRFLRATGMLDGIDPDRTAFSLLFQCKTVVRQFGDLEQILRNQGMLKGRSVSETFPLILDYDFADAQVDHFIHDLWRNLRLRNGTSPVLVFEETLRQHYKAATA